MAGIRADIEGYRDECKALIEAQQLWRPLKKQMPRLVSS